MFLIIITFSSAPFIFSGSFYDTEMGRISGSFEPSFFAPILTAPETSSLGGKNSKLKLEETIKTMTLAYPLHTVILFKGYGRLKKEDYFYVYWSVSSTSLFLLIVFCTNNFLSLSFLVNYACIVRRECFAILLGNVFRGYKKD